MYPSGAAIDVIAARAREQRSQIVFTTARGRDMVFWQSPAPANKPAPTSAYPPPALLGSPSCPSSSIPASATPLGELATLPRAAVVVEDRYTQHYVRPAQVADGLAELQGAGYTVTRLGSSRPDGAAPNGDLVVATTAAAHRPVFVDEAHPAQQCAPAG